MRWANAFFCAHPARLVQGDGKGRDSYLHVLMHRHAEKETATELPRMANLLYLKIFVLEPGVDVLEGGEVLDRVITKQQFR